ncbi:substrate-binding domain-containing protein [Nitrospira sp. Kam-Ns4a]
MATRSVKARAEPVGNFENRLRALRTAKGLSQGALADLAGVTRQAIYAIEANQYLPTTAVALRLAAALDCRVEDLFSLASGGEVIEGDWIGPGADAPEAGPVRVKVARVGNRIVVRPVAALGEVLNYTVPADGLMVRLALASGRGGRRPARATVRLLRDRRTVDGEILVAGCDPALFLAGEYLRRRLDQATVVEWTMGSVAALEALRQGEVHMAGLHLVDARSGEANLPYLRRHWKGPEVRVVTFAAWAQGLMVRRGNPKGLREVADLARRDVVLVNREEGAGARLLLDQKLAAAGIKAEQVKGYQRTVRSHLEVARFVAEGQADAGMGVQSAARLFGLDFVPLQQERYDLVIPTEYLETHPGLAAFLDTIVSRSFRAEIEALGGYDTRETGKVRSLRAG